MATKIRGLTTEEVNKSKELHGDNSLSKEKRQGFFKRFFGNLCDPIIKILLIALGVQIVLTFGHINYLEIGGILAAILLSCTVSTLSEYRSESAFEKLREDSSANFVSVLRDGEIRKIPSSELVVGDILYLFVGEKIQADGEIVEGRISVDQSALNGESEECHKSAGKDHSWDLTSPHKVFRGSLITEGNAIMRVLRVGGATFYGMVAKDVQTETRVSPLKLRLSKLASQISKIGYVMALVVGLTYLFNALVIDNGFDIGRIMAEVSDVRGLFGTLISALTLMITVVVVAAPEGLPMMITVILSANMKKMLRDNILVKKLVGIETAGSMNILFTDKTGTLTVGKPECVEFITAEGSFKGINQLRQSGRIYDYLNLCAHYNTDVLFSEEGLTGGNPTDRAIYNFFSCEASPVASVLTKESFSSDKKYSSVTLKNGKTVIKGAAERILGASRYAISSNGERVRFDLKNVYEGYMSALKLGHRVIGVAVREGKKEELTFVALIVMKDKIRKGVWESVKQVLGAGIQVVMITGDSRETAVSIAQECGIMNPKAGHISLSSEDLNNMTDEEIKSVLPKLRVVSRALPRDKTRLVRLSQEMNLVVGMTGDGINDAPSLKLSDVGFAMGSGTDIAKSASDIVILDDSFLAISRTILYGRTIFKSIRKFITFQLTMNLAACGVSLIGQFIGVETPITIIQMLWINIIMDTLGGLAFAGEAPLEYYMQEKPIRRDEQILSREMLNQIFITGAFTLGLSLLFLSSPRIRMLYGGFAPTDSFYTAFYALFIFSGLVNSLLARCSRLWLFSNILKNKPFVFIMILIWAIQLAMIYFGGEMFRCVGLSVSELGFVILLSLTVIPFEMIRRLLYKLK